MAKRRGKDKHDDELAELYALPLDEFVAGRDALAKRLRNEGKTERAREVKGLRKPSRSAWALNRGARESPRAAKRLLDAGARLEAAQRAALSGGGRDELRDAMSAHQEAVEEMTGAVEAAVGKEAGLNAPALDRVRETLRAAAGDPELRAELDAARVTRDRQAVGFGEPGEAPPARPPRRRRKGPTQAQRRKAEQRAKRAQRDLDAATKALTQARSRLDRAQRDLASAQRQVEEAEAKRSDGETERDDARAALEELRG